VTEKLGPYTVHPFAAEFPLLEGEGFAQLVADIKQHGLRDAIILSNDGAILIDGRNRYRACEVAGVDAVFRNLPARYTDLMIADFVVSENVKRRHLDAGQLAFAALAYEKHYGKAAKEAQREHGGTAPGRPATLPAGRPEVSRDRESRQRAAKAVGASGRSVSKAKAVQRDAPDLAAEVKAGRKTLDAADKERRQRKAAEPKPEREKAGPTLLTLRTHDGTAVLYPQPKAAATFNETKGEGISWAAWSWNPVTGCLHGCNYCYARELATRDSYSKAYPVGFTPLFHHQRLAAPANTRVPRAHTDDPAYRRVFVCSMADLYGRWVPDEWIEQVHASCRANPQWDYLMLTKFPTRYVDLALPATAWIGTSVDEQKRVRIAEDAFRRIEGVRVRWLSLEPLREPLEFSDLSMFDWVVIGAQTETHQPGGRVEPAFAPPFEWVARIAAQAREAGCRVHMKPNLLGAASPQLPGMQLLNEYPDSGRVEPAHQLAIAATS
jgi:protein gp37/ParB-like chromosome segregation protein Spo0J